MEEGGKVTRGLGECDCRGGVCLVFGAGWRGEGINTGSAENGERMRRFQKKKKPRSHQTECGELKRVTELGDFKCLREVNPSGGSEKSGPV